MIFDAIVVGLGAMGSAALYQLSRQTPNVLGLDQFAPPHTRGSTHGDTRITRQAIGEGDYFVPLALRSYDIWRELEQSTGKHLLTITGGLFIGREHSDVITRNKTGWLTNTIQVAEQFGIAHRILDNEALRQEFPQFRFRPDDIGYYEAEAGFLNPELCVSVQLAQARQQGATVRLNERMIDYKSTATGIVVRTDQGEYHTRKLILTTGAWLTESLRDTPYQDLLRVYRQVLYWFDIEGDYAQYTSDRLPVFIFSDRDVYGFPAIGGPNGGIKIATETYAFPTAPTHVERMVGAAEIRQMYEQFVVPTLLGISSVCLKSAVCLYTMTPNGDFIIDRHPTQPDVLLASACSGHGFKHSAAVGQMLAELTLSGQTTFDHRPFQLDRFLNY